MWLVFHQKLAQGNLMVNLRQVPFHYQLKSVLRLLALAFTPVFYPSHDYAYLEHESFFYLMGGAAVFVGTGALLWRWGRRGERLLYVSGAGFLFFTVVPLYNFRHPDFIRLGYIPAVGAGLAAAALATWLARRRPLGRFLAAGLCLLGLSRGVQVVQQILDY